MVAGGRGKSDRHIHLVGKSFRGGGDNQLCRRLAFFGDKFILSAGSLKSRISTQSTSRTKALGKDWSFAFPHYDVMLAQSTESFVRGISMLAFRKEILPILSTMGG